MARKHQISPIDWKISFQLDDGRVYVTDKSILLDQRYVFVDPLPPDGTDRSSELIRKKNYKRTHAYLGLSAHNSFGMDDLTVGEDGDYDGPEKLVLGVKYISFLLHRIPRDLLRFGMTGDNKKPVRIFRGKEAVGLLMPVIVHPDFGPELIAMAKDGDAEAQCRLGAIYYCGACGAPKDQREAVRWFAKAAGQNHPEALMRMGLAYFLELGVRMDWVKSLLFFEKAIEHGGRKAGLWRRRLITMMPPQLYRAASMHVARQLAPDETLSLFWPDADGMGTARPCLRIAIIETEPQLARIFVKLLTETLAGKYELSIVTFRQEEVLRHYWETKREPFQLAIVHVNNVIVSGSCGPEGRIERVWELLPWLRETNGGPLGLLPVCSHNYEGSMGDAIQAGSDLYLPCPFGLDEIKSFLNQRFV